MTTMDRESAYDRGLWFGLAVFALVGLAIYLLHGVLAQVISDWWATFLLYVPAFFAVLLIRPAQERYAHFALRRYCQRAGHEPDHGRGPHAPVFCERCRALLAPGDAANVRNAGT
ncbi:hypothetical protein [Luteimonas changyuni]|uniref:hypothetical protein n=1 Tax=Luteimonas sp. MJ145 TaxID=3129234 RepID=UPI0031BB1F8F